MILRGEGGVGGACGGTGSTASAARRRTVSPPTIAPDGPPRMEARPTGSGRERSSPNRCDQCRGQARHLSRSPGSISWRRQYWRGLAWTAVTVTRKNEGAVSQHRRSSSRSPARGFCFETCRHLRRGAGFFDSAARHPEEQAAQAGSSMRCCAAAISLPLVAPLWSKAPGRWISRQRHGFGV